MLQHSSIVTLVYYLSVYSDHYIKDEFYLLSQQPLINTPVQNRDCVCKVCLSYRWCVKYVFCHNKSSNNK